MKFWGGRLWPNLITFGCAGLLTMTVLKEPDLPNPFNPSAGGMSQVVKRASAGRYRLALRPDELAADKRG